MNIAGYLIGILFWLLVLFVTDASGWKRSVIHVIIGVLSVLTIARVILWWRGKKNPKTPDTDDYT